MKLLLDTHVFLWFTGEPAKLPSKFLEAIVDPGNEIYLSVVSFWEVAVTYQLGKLPLKEDPAVLVPQERAQAGFQPLPLEEQDILFLRALPSLHRDPFDRLLVCQTLRHGMRLVTDDHMLRKYPVPLLT
jgi:PIN domain nuclease of toxin-antitoxin system